MRSSEELRVRMRNYASEIIRLFKETGELLSIFITMVSKLRNSQTK